MGEIDLQSHPALASARKMHQDVAFVIERSTNKNVVLYKIRVDGDKMDAKNPVHVFWIMWEKAQDGSVTEELNMIERNTAYGTSIVSANDKECEMVMASLKDRKIRMAYENGTSVAKTTINGVADCVLLRIFVQMKSGWVPKVDYVEIFGVDPSGKHISEKKKP